MRWPALLGVAGGVAACLGADCVSVGAYCPDFSWSQRASGWLDADSPVPIPVDAAPWLLRPCEHRMAPEDCALAVDGVAIPVTATIVGACDLPFEDELTLVSSQHVIQTLVPSQPLPAGARVTLDCDDPDLSPYDSEYYGYGYGYQDGPLALPRTTQIRTSSAPAGPPGALGTLELQYTRDDPELSCARGDYITVKIDFTAPFLHEGGYVEVVYPSGQVFEFSRARADGVAIMPPTRGLIRFTPVAIDGTRGETVVIDASTIPAEKVYVPGCAQSPSPGLPALLVPLTWLALSRRRRAGSAP